MIRVGTCGWSAKGGRKAYYKYFNVIELQDTFYKLPREETAKRWRETAPVDFEFTVKAWQVITHPPSSPTWRRSGIEVTPEMKDKYGYFRPTDQVFEAWQAVKKLCLILETKVCVFQTPPSFGYSKENADNVEAFFSSIDRAGLVLGWEPRGTWHNHPDEVKRLCDSLDIVHVVDILRRDPVTTHDVCYFRLHGLGGREVNYRYKYTDKDLAVLKEKVERYEEESEVVYVMFNNIYMFEDALRFKKLLGEDVGE